MKTSLFFVIIGVSAGIAFADQVNVDGPIVSTGSRVQAATHIQAGSHIQAGTTMYAGGAITSATGFAANGATGYVIAGGPGYIGNFLRIGGAANTPAAKSVQIGQYATANSFNSLVVGQYNVIEGTSSSWNGIADAKEPLFVAGNGLNAGSPRNAFAVYKDGTITMSKAQGDIGMGQFGNP